MKSARFQELLESFATKRVSIIGDFILDEYLLGDTKRVSREAPVIVIDHRDSRYHPGGAANAAQNVAVLGASARAFGLVGTDTQGETLANILRETGVDTGGLVTAHGLNTAVKTRILAGELHAQRQQVARIDRSYQIGAGDELAALEKRIDDILEADAVLLSDYAMGVMRGVGQTIIDACRKRDIPIVLDTRCDLMRYRGATVATPNEVELFIALKLRDGDPRNLSSLAADVIETTELGGLIITRGSQGMQVVGGDDSGTVGIVGSSDVADVTGAGDTVAASVALSVASGATFLEAAEMATYAASVVVMKRGTATVSRQELLEIQQTHPSPVGGSARQRTDE